MFGNHDNFTFGAKKKLHECKNNIVASKAMCLWVFVEYIRLRSAKWKQGFTAVLHYINCWA